MENREQRRRDLSDIHTCSKKIEKNEFRLSILNKFDQNQQTKVQKLLKRFNLTDSFNVIYDDDGLIMKNFGSLRVPETFLFRKNGELLKKYVGPQDWKNDYFLKNTTFLIER